MTTVVLTRVPRDLGWAQLVRAICHHARVHIADVTSEIQAWAVFLARAARIEAGDPRP